MFCYEATIFNILPYREYIVKTRREMNSNFNNIIQGCIRRDRQSQNELYRLYYSYAMSISFRYLGSEEESIEVVNDSFMKVFNNLKKYDLQYDFKPWFRKIIVNTTLDKMRAQKKLQMQINIDEANQVSSREDILSRIGYQELISLVSTLSIAYRTVFNMYVIDGYKHDEIAHKLNISVGTSKSNLSKARGVLQKRISDQLKIQHG